MFHLFELLKHNKKYKHIIKLLDFRIRWRFLKNETFKMWDGLFFCGGPGGGLYNMGIVVAREGFCWEKLFAFSIFQPQQQQQHRGVKA